MRRLYEDIVDRIGEQSAGSLTGLLGLLEQGTITRAEFIDTASTVVDTANIRGHAAGQAYFRAYIEEATGTPYALAPTVVASERDRLAKAMTTILTTEQDTTMQLQRLATVEPIQSASNGFQDAMQKEHRVTGWERGLDSGACQLCSWWWRDGRIFHKDHTMPRHKGCRCHPIPRINVQTSNYQTTRNRAAAADQQDRRTRRNNA